MGTASELMPAIAPPMPSTGRARRPPCRLRQRRRAPRRAARARAPRRSAHPAPGADRVRGAPRPAGPRRGRPAARAHRSPADLVLVPAAEHLARPRVAPLRWQDTGLEPSWDDGRGVQTGARDVLGPGGDPRTAPPCARPAQSGHDVGIGQGRGDPRTRGSVGLGRARGAVGARWIECRLCRLRAGEPIRGARAALDRQAPQASTVGRTCGGLPRWTTNTGPCAATRMAEPACWSSRRLEGMAGTVTSGEVDTCPRPTRASTRVRSCTEAPVPTGAGWRGRIREGFHAVRSLERGSAARWSRRSGGSCDD